MLISRFVGLTSAPEGASKVQPKYIFFDRALGARLSRNIRAPRRLVLVLTLLASVLFLVPAALSAPGQLDLTFNACKPGESGGCGGKSILDFGDEDYARAIAIQKDGKIVVGGQRGSLRGSSDISNLPDFALARYNPDGSLDSTFGNKGKVTTDFGGAEMLTALAIQTDGKIVAGGTVAGNDPTEKPDSDFALARYNPDGTADLSFGLAGKVTTDWTYQEYLSSLAIQGDGKIVAAGPGVMNGNEITRARPGRQIGPYMLGLVRYEKNGVLDSSFGGDGVVTSDSVGSTSTQDLFDFGEPTKMLGLVMQDDKFVLAGTGSQFRFGNCPSPCPLDFGLARLNADGSLDQSFGSSGLAYDSVGPGNDGAMAVAVHNLGDSNQGLVAAGFVQPCAPSSTCVSDFALARYSKDGLLDPSWGKAGTVTTDFGAKDFATSVAVQADGKVVAAGSSCSSPSLSCHFALARYTAGGLLDASFGTGGKVITDFVGGNAVVTGVAVHPDTRLIAAGAGPGDFLTAAYLDRLVDLSVTLAARPDPVVRGEPLTYEARVTNSGEQAAEDVVFTMNLADLLKYESALPAQGSCQLAMPVLTCRLGRIEANSSAVFSVRAIAPASLVELTTTSQVSTPTFEPNKANNQAVVVTSVTQLPPIVPKGDAIVGGPGRQTGSNETITSQPPSSTSPPPVPPGGSSLTAGGGIQGSPQIPGPPPTGVSAQVPPALQTGVLQAANGLPGASLVPSASGSLATPALGAYLPSFEPEPAPRHLMVGKSPLLPYVPTVLALAISSISMACGICNRRRPELNWTPGPSPAPART